MAWVTWPAGDEYVIHCLRPIRHIEFFVKHGNQWFPFGRRMPTTNVPEHDTGVPLDRIVVPEAMDVVAATNSPNTPLRLMITRGGPVYPATALRCTFDDLTDWIDAATTAQLAKVRGAQCGGRVLLLGDHLPHVEDGERFHGQRVLTPLGFRTEPDWPEAWICAACGAGDNDLVVLDQTGAELVPRSIFSPLTRAGLRCAMSTTG